jgi:hypothetical protein
MKKEKLPITCPLCGRKGEYRIENLAENTFWKCLFCPTSLTLHGHMWEDIKTEIAKLNEGEEKNGCVAH